VLPVKDQPQYYMGKIKDEQRGILKLKYPIQHGVIKNWQDMELIWNYCYKELQVNPKETPVLLTEPALSSF
jgi:actin-related protein